jgi:hypothetical protein
MAAACSGPPERDVFLPPYAEKGCWARFYAQADFAGPMRQLEGPAFVESIGATPVLVAGIEQTAPQPLFWQVRSLVVGPHARIVGYAETLFRAPSMELPPGMRIADAAAIGFYDRVQSFSMQCVVTSPVK